MKLKKAAAVLLTAAVVVLIGLAAIRGYINDQSGQRRRELDARAAEVAVLKAEVDAAEAELLPKAEAEAQRLLQEAESLIRQAAEADIRQVELQQKITALQAEAAEQAERNEYLRKVYDALYEGLETARGYLAGN